MTEIRSGPIHTIFPDSGTESLPTPRWREMDSNFWYRGTRAVDFRSIPGMAGDRRGSLKRHHLIIQPFFFCARS